MFRQGQMNYLRVRRLTYPSSLTHWQQHTRTRDQEHNVEAAAARITRKERSKAWENFILDKTKKAITCRIRMIR